MLSQDAMNKISRSLILHEKRTNFPYVDTLGNITIGIGYNLSARGIDDEWIDSRFNEDVQYFYSQLTDHFPWFSKLNTDRQIILVDMCFMGFKRFLGFTEMIAALEAGDYDKASKEMLDSEWAKQVKQRAFQLAHAMKIGIYEV